LRRSCSCRSSKSKRSSRMGHITGNGYSALLRRDCVLLHGFLHSWPSVSRPGSSTIFSTGAFIECQTPKSARRRVVFSPGPGKQLCRQSNSRANRRSRLRRVELPRPGGLTKASTQPLQKRRGCLAIPQAASEVVVCLMRVFLRSIRYRHLQSNHRCHGTCAHLPGCAGHVSGYHKPPAAAAIRAARADQQIVMWYSVRYWTLWILLIGLPFAAMLTGCATLLR